MTGYRPGWVVFRHKITGETRELNPHRVDAIRALKRERHPHNPLRSAWERPSLNRLPLDVRRDVARTLAAHPPRDADIAIHPARGSIMASMLFLED